MSSQRPHNDVQHELEALSPELAQLRLESVPSADMDTLHQLGKGALDAVPLETRVDEIATNPMRLIHSRRRWTTVIAAAIAIMIGALLTYSVLTPAIDSSEYTNTNETISDELIASFEEQTADPIAFLLDDESMYADEESLFSPAEGVLLDWADDGNVDVALSEEMILDALR